MRVQIKEVNKDEKVIIRSIGEEKVYGYWTSFWCELTSGYAYVVPYKQSLDKLIPGCVISVEISQSSIEGFRRLRPTEKTGVVRPQPKLGDYWIQGMIQQVMQGEAGGIECLEIVVGDATFVLDSEEMNGDIHVKAGDGVSFEIIGMQLFEEGL
ncbi:MULTISPECIES: hypothetical protein [unclassified Paenibacillus]|uniref:hypothetical protein n=1 Tax=unclassified Paenibacillus TaxID=185978 RepID=UPI000F6FE753|nr:MULTISPECIES: hypothetical protein [unclassified Paenibacillus]AZH28576.1 hypothetical protein EGM68_07260 [Paenibacillus sp. M-152]KAF6564602.1 hypothetical protein G9G63_10705 [Paenibacillus sp. EKM202P]KAF6571583.1 hypothetical protein G9G64_06070 [Paenibacillus sp. EKM207P]